MGLFRRSSAMSRSRFSFQLYLGWIMILSRLTIFSMVLSYLKGFQTEKQLQLFAYFCHNTVSLSRLLVNRQVQWTAKENSFSHSHFHKAPTLNPEWMRGGFISEGFPWWQDLQLQIVLQCPQLVLPFLNSLLEFSFSSRPRAQSSPPFKWDPFPSQLLQFSVVFANPHKEVSRSEVLIPGWVEDTVGSGQDPAITNETGTAEQLLWAPLEEHHLPRIQSRRERSVG